MRPHIIIILILTTLMAVFLAATPPAYYPSGPQNNVPETDLVGWLRCWSGSYGEYNKNNTVIDYMFKTCPGDYLLYGCRIYGETNLTLLAAGERTAVLNNTGVTSSDVTTNNGVDWYFSPLISLGFAVEGDGVDKDSCDLATGAYPEKRLCWHAQDYADGVPKLYGGYRCGEVQGMSPTLSFTREIWTQDPCVNLNDGAACNDGNLCTTNDMCNNGICNGTLCGTCLECDPYSGCVPVMNGLSCSDDSLCTKNDTCQQGVCVGEISVTCDIPQGCFNSTCIALTGQCHDECPAPLAPVTVPIMTPVISTTPTVKAPNAKISGSSVLLVLNGLVLGIVVLFH